MKLGTKRAALEPEYMWETSLDPSTVADTFVACGVLYGVEADRGVRRSGGGGGRGRGQRGLKVAFAVDLYDSRVVDRLDIPVVNVYRRMTMINYNPRLPVGQLRAYSYGTSYSYYCTVQNESLYRPWCLGTEATR